MVHDMAFIITPRHRNGAHHGRLSSRHNAGCGNAIMWSCVPHGHSSPSHAIEVVRNMAFIITPQRGVCPCHNVELRTAWSFIAKPRHRDGAHHGHLSPYHNAGYGNAIMWSCVPHGHSSPRHSIGMVRGKMMYRH